MVGSLSSLNTQGWPRAADPERAALGWTRLEEVASPREEHKEIVRSLKDDARARALMDGIFAASPFLTDCALKEIALLARLGADGPDAAFAAIRGDLARLRAERPLPDAAMRPLRLAKRRAALTIAWGDLTGAWDVARVTGALSRLAEDTLDVAVGAALDQEAARGKIRLPDGADPPPARGYAVIGMGKLGAGELNYSSDIDLIVLYDPELLARDDPRDLRQPMVRATQAMIALMQSRTGDGYVFRTDLRLRPDPGMTPIAMPVSAAETYYESMGQNWERAAMIKARPVAGDRALGEDFLAHIRPFVWRRHLDFWAIQDIHSIKRQINAHRGGRAIAVEGHNIKIGRGGIREIEFYAQTLQLIWGGRQPELRERGTVEALRKLVALGHADADAVDDLAAAYDFLRRLEHRLQMLEDSQTQTLPADAEGIARLAAFMGFDDDAAFRAALLGHLRRVERHYAGLFEEAPDLGGGGALVFTGTDDDPDTLATLAGLGYRDPARVSGIVRAWHTGRYRATRSTRSREILTELMPRLLRAFGDTVNPDEAFLRFDAFLKALPAGIQVFSLLAQNGELLGLLAEVMGSAPRLADRLSRYPILLEALLDGQQAERFPDKAALKADLETALGEARDFQDVLDLARRWNNDRRFQIGLALLRRTLDGVAAAPLLSDLADVTLDIMIAEVERDFARAHGRVPGGAFGAVAMGKLGGREMSPGSDLDIVFVYDHAAGADASDGPKALAPSVYYQRLAQRVITAITTLTGEGTLYELDTRLRPHGSKGPIATGIEAWRRYYETDAWTWEVMAMTRARAVAGPETLRCRLDATRRAVLASPRDPDVLVERVAAMRERIRATHPGRDPWDVKHRAGGMVDAEFCVQYLLLRHCPDNPDLAGTSTFDSLDRLIAAEVAPAALLAGLRDGLVLWRNLQTAIRLTCPEGGFRPDTAPAGLKRLLEAACGGCAFEALAAQMDEAMDRVRAAFDHLVEAPAARLGARPTDRTTETEG